MNFSVGDDKIRRQKEKLSGDSQTRVRKKTLEPLKWPGGDRDAESNDKKPQLGLSWSRKGDDQPQTSTM